MIVRAELDSGQVRPEDPVYREPVRATRGACRRCGPSHSGTAAGRPRAPALLLSQPQVNRAAWPGLAGLTRARDRDGRSGHAGPWPQPSQAAGRGRLDGRSGQQPGRAPAYPERPLPRVGPGQHGGQPGVLATSATGPGRPGQPPDRPYGRCGFGDVADQPAAGSGG